MNGNGIAVSASGEDRRYDVDALRVMAFGLLILYHVGMFYVQDWGWHVKSAYQAEWLQAPMLFVNQWRMSLLFVISGLAMSFVWPKYSPAQLALRRIWCLLIPLLFGMTLVVAPQPYYEALGKGLIEPGFLAFLGKYLTFGDFPAGAWEGQDIITWTWNHLWYLPYLLCYTLLLIPFAAFMDGPGIRLRRWFQELRGVWLVVVPVVPLMLYGNFVFPRFPYVNHALIDDWYAHALYCTLFFYGYLIGRAPAFWTALAAIRWRLLIGAIAMYGLFLLRNAVVEDEPGFVIEQVAFAITYLNRWLWILVLFSWGFSVANRPMRFLPYATEAVYPWYILHQTIIVVVGFNLARLDLGPFIEPLLVLVLTALGCLLLHEFLIRRIPLLRPLFGLRYAVGRRAASRPPAEPLASAGEV